MKNIEDGAHNPNLGSSSSRHVQAACDSQFGLVVGLVKLVPAHLNRMATKKKGSPLPLGDTLRDLALLRASDCDLTAALPTQAATQEPSSGSTSRDVDTSVERSYEFVKETRAAIRLLHRGEADRQGGRVEDVRSRLEDVVAGLETS